MQFIYRLLQFVNDLLQFIDCLNYLQAQPTQHYTIGAAKLLIWSLQAMTTSLTLGYQTWKPVLQACTIRPHECVSSDNPAEFTQPLAVV